MGVTKSLSDPTVLCTVEDLATAFGLQAMHHEHPLRNGRVAIAGVHWVGDTRAEPGHPWLGLVPSGMGVLPADLGQCVSLVVDAATVRSAPAWLDTVPFDILVTAEDVELDQIALDLQAAVEHATLSMLTRALGVQRDLMDALTSQRVEHEVVNRLHRRLHVGAAIVSATGAIIAASPGFPDVVAERASELCTPGSDEYAFDGFDILVSTFAQESSRVHLVLVWPQGQGIHRTELHAATNAAEVVMRAHERAILLARQEDFALRAQLLAELLAGVSPNRLDEIAAELTALDVPLDGPFIIHVIRNRSTQPQRLDELLQRMRARIGQDRSLMLVGTIEEDIVFICASSSQLTDLLLRDERSAWHGVSADFNDLHAAPDALRQARISLATGQRTGTFTPFADLDFLDFVLGQIPADVFQEKTGSMLKRLSGGAMLLETMVEFFRQSMDVQSTAQAMHLHPNTIRYRLHRIEVTLGMSLSDPETITVLYLVLRDRILDGSPSFLDSVAAIS